jgi:integrase
VDLYTAIYTSEQMKVGIQDKKGWLILAWNDGKRRTMATGIRADIAGARALAQKIATRIELDFLQRDEGRYDETLLKYKPHLLGKSATEISAPELFDRFTKQRAKAKGLAQSGINSRYIPVRKMLEKVLDIPANTVGKREAEKFADACDEPLPPSKKKIQPSTAQARIWLLVSCWDWAKGKYNVAEENPFKGLSARFRSQQKNKKKPFSLVEVRGILDGFRSSRYYAHYADYAAFLLGVGTRPGEAAGLLWENVAADFTSVYICQSFSRGVVGDTKTKESRTVNLSPSIVAMLNRRMEAQQPKPSDLVFFTPNGLPIDDRNFRRRAWTMVLKDAGVKYRSPYKSRGTAARGASHFLFSDRKLSR